MYRGGRIATHTIAFNTHTNVCIFNVYLRIMIRNPTMCLFVMD